MRHSAIGMALVAPDGSFLEVNAALCDILGRDEATLRAATWQQLTHPDDLAVDAALLEEVLTGPLNSYRLAKRYLRPDGSVVHGDLSVVGMRGLDGRVEYLISQIVDMTDQEQLRARLQLLAENSSDVVALTDDDGVVQWISGSVTRVAGWAPSEVVGRRSIDFVHSDDQPIMREGQARLRAGEWVEAELRMRSKAGGYRWSNLRVRPVFDAAGVPVGRVSSWWDAEEAHRSREALARSEEKLRLSLEAQADIHLFLEGVRDETGRVVDYMMVDGNQAAFDYFGQDRADLLGRPLLVDMPPDKAARLRASYEHTLDTGEPLAIDGWVGFPVESRDPHFFDLRGARVGDSISLSARDVTDRVRAQDALEVSERQAHDLAERYEQARDAALAASGAKNAFLSRMSHELRTPLNAILGFAQLLEREQLTAEQQAFVAHIRSGGGHLLGLVSEVLDVSRIESGTLALSMEPVSVDSAVDQTLDLVGNQAAAASVTLRRVECRGSVSHVWADRRRVIQVLANLLSNGIKYNRPGGSVEIGCAELGLGTVAIRVTDTGPGLHPHQIARLFEPFERLGAEHSLIEGTGIGLALSQGLAQAMGGRIEVESTVGEGSVFSLVLPKCPGAGTDGDGPKDVHQPTGSLPADVLYIEDNSENQHLMSHIVRLPPTATLRMADDGTCGLRAAHESTPDLILLDLHLPDIQGDEVLERLRRDAVLAAVPVVVVTADATPDLDDRLIRLGATGVITKPVDVGQVLAWIDRACESGH